MNKFSRSVSLLNSDFLTHYYYRVSEQVSDLSLVDFDLDVPPILPSCFAYSADLSSAQVKSGRQWNSKSVNPTQVRDLLGQPVLESVKNSSFHDSNQRIRLKLSKIETLPSVSPSFPLRLIPGCFVVEIVANFRKRSLTQLALNSSSIFHSPPCTKA